MYSHLKSFICRLLAKSYPRSRRGFGIINVIMVGAITSVTTLAVTTAVLRQQRSQDEVIFRNNISDIRSSLMSAIISDTSWVMTAGKNAFMKCTSPASPYCNPASISRTSIALYNAGGELIFDGQNPQSGYRFDGTRCTEFSSSGNDNCPLRPSVLWRAVCRNATCTEQEDLVSISFDFKPSSKNYPFNPLNYNVVEQSRYKFGGNDSPVMICARQGMVFIGDGMSFNGHNSNTEGCVSYLAFRGMVGPSGPSGPMGPVGSRGPTGPMGPAGADAYCP